MRLLTVGSLPPEWGGAARGGAATFHAALLTELRGRSDVEIAGVLPPEPPGRELPVPAWPRPEGVPRAQHYEELLETLQPDAVLMSHVAHTVGATHALLGSPVPALGVAHSWHNVAFEAGDERRRAVELTKQALSGLDALVVPSRHLLAEGRAHGFRYPPLVETIHNPVPPLYMGEWERGERAARRVVFVGSLIPRKRPEALVEAAALSPGLELLMIGQGEQEGELRKRIASLRIERRVALAEPPSGGAHLPWVRDAISRAGTVCLPSDSEGLPLAFVEALACGTPIVGFGPAVREIREELGIDVGEPLDGGSPEEIAAALERVLARDWDREELRRAALEGFGLDRVADRYLDLLGRTASPGAPTVPAARPSRPAEAAPVAVRICVLGPSRSGTSLTASLLAAAGVHLGPEDELLGEERSQLASEGEEVLARARCSNPGGHFEHYRLMRLNERILRALGGSWRDPPPLPAGWEHAAELAELREEARAILAESFAGHALWAWKDPRNSLTLPFWRLLLPELRCVVCLRHPLEVAGSLHRRDGIELAAGVEQWTRYLAAALVNTAGLPRLLVRYEDYFRDPVARAEELARFAGRAGSFQGAGGEAALAAAIDPGLWRQRLAEGDPQVGALPTDARSLLRVAELLAWAGVGPEAARVNAAADRFAEGVLSRASTPQPALVS